MEEEKVLDTQDTQDTQATQDTHATTRDFVVIKDPITGKMVQAPRDQRERIRWLRERYEQHLKAEQEEVARTVEDTKELERMALSVLVSVCRRPSKSKDRNRVSAAKAILDYIKGKVPQVDQKAPTWEDIVREAHRKGQET